MKRFLSIHSLLSSAHKYHKNRSSNLVCKSWGAKHPTNSWSRIESAIKSGHGSMKSDPEEFIMRTSITFTMRGFMDSKLKSQVHRRAKGSQGREGMKQHRTAPKAAESWLGVGEHHGCPLNFVPYPPRGLGLGRTRLAANIGQPVSEMS